MLVLLLVQHELDDWVLAESLFLNCLIVKYELICVYLVELSTHELKVASVIFLGRVLKLRVSEPRLKSLCYFTGAKEIDKIKESHKPCGRIGGVRYTHECQVS